MRAAFFSLLLTAAATASSASAERFAGTAKSVNTGDFVPNECAYDEFSNQFVSAAESRFAFVSASLWDDADAPQLCGRCANVSLARTASGAMLTPNSTVTVMLISNFDDECSGGDRDASGSDEDIGSEEIDERDCTHDLLLSDQAYRDMLNQGTGSRFRVEWEFVTCPSDFVDGGIEFVFDDATTPNLITVQPRNFHGSIESLAVEFEDGASFPLEPSFGSFQSVVLTDGKHFFSQPFSLVATQANTNDSISVKLSEQPVPNLVVITDAQFDQ